MGHPKESIFINVPMPKVQEFGSDPRNWPKFMVGLTEPTKISGDGGQGTVVECDFVTLGIHMPVTLKVVEDSVDPDGCLHRRLEAEGKVSGWQTWDIEPQGGGTYITVEREYTMPGSVLGDVGDRLLFEMMQARDTHHSLENLKLLMEEPPG